MQSKGFRIKHIGAVVRTYCPFPDHRETKPSFTLYPHDNSYHCFGCKEHGTILNLMRLFGDPISPELLEEERKLKHALDVRRNPVLKDRIRRATSILLRIRRMRTWYKNQSKLNAIMYRVIKLFEGVKLEDFKFKRSAYSLKRR